MATKYDYSLLRGLIRQHFRTLSDYAMFIGISSTSLNARLNGELPFKQNEIAKSIEGFGTSADRIDDIFFSPLNTENRKQVD